jgi:hypothetical protein
MRNASTVSSMSSTWPVVSGAMRMVSRYVGDPGPDGVIQVTSQTTITGGEPTYFKKDCPGSSEEHREAQAG